MDHAHNHNAKNLVICCDGIGNEISEIIFNLPKFYHGLQRTNGRGV